MITRAKTQAGTHTKITLHGDTIVSSSRWMCICLWLLRCGHTVSWNHGRFGVYSSAERC